MLKRSNFTAQDIIDIVQPYYNMAPDTIEHIIGELEDVLVDSDEYHALAWDCNAKMFVTFGTPLPKIPVTNRNRRKSKHEQ